MKSATDSVSPRRDGSMLAASSRRSRLVARTRPLGERVARRSCAAAPNADVDQLEHPLAELCVGGPRRGLVAVDADQPGVHPRDRPEYRRRHHPVAPDIAEEPDLDAWHAVVLAAGFGGEPLGDLGLHHHHHRADRRELGEQVQQRWDGDVVRQVGHQRCRLGSGASSARCSVRMSRLSTVNRLISLWECSAIVFGSCRASSGSISTAVTLAPRSSSAQRQRTQAGTDLKDVVTGD